MGNMSYCRFQNTVADLLDCQEALDSTRFEYKELFDKEQQAVLSLIQICEEIANDHKYLIDEELRGEE